MEKPVEITREDFAILCRALDLNLSPDEAEWHRTGWRHSLQIVGRAFDDATVLRLGHAYEQATPWRQRRPAI